MKRKAILKRITVALSLVSMFSLVGCGGASKADGENASGEQAVEKQEKDPTEITGTVDMCVWPKDEETFNSIIADFNEVYPNVKVELSLMDGWSASDYLTARAATSDLPDIVNSPDVAYALSQGWVQDLSEFVEGDEDFKYVPQTIVDDYTLDGQLFSMPFQANTSGIIINLDLLDKLNMDVPSYEWTIDEFIEMAKKATNKDTSGINNLDYLLGSLVAKFNNESSENCYDPETSEFNLTDGSYQKALNVLNELESVPGVVADKLKNDKLREEGKVDDYQKKFGKEVDAFMDGKVLFGNYGCWALDWWKPDFNYDFYPLPNDSETGYRQSVGFDNYYMMNTAPDKEATFAFLKWITYSPEGMTKQLEARAELENPIPYLFIPPTTIPEVKDLYNELTYIPEGLKYIYSRIDESYRGPKISPGYGAGSELINETIAKAQENNDDVTARLSEIEKQANDEVKEGLDNLRKEMDKFDVYKK